MSISNFNIFSRIKNYRKLSKEIQAVLVKNPGDASKFQEIFNLTVDRIYQDIMNFERENIDKFELDVYRLKKIFEKRYRSYFLYGEYIKWCAEKPLGYAGDFKIIDDIYRNEVHTSGFDGLWDNWFQQLAASKSVRQRKDDFRNMIIGYLKEHPERNLRFMNLACGPAREIKELSDLDSGKNFSRATFDCYDQDNNALVYAKQLLSDSGNVNFFQKNAIRLALKKDIKDEIPYKYDLIYSTGLFDYLNERLAVRLLKNLKVLLKPEGLILISNARDKYSNSSSMWMEWIGEWYLIYRTEEEFKNLFLGAGFHPDNVQIISQQDKVMQYCVAK